MNNKEVWDERWNSNNYLICKKILILSFNQFSTEEYIYTSEDKIKFTDITGEVSYFEVPKLVNNLWYAKDSITWISKIRI